eukprot:evm.model.NODE_39865_length_11153_cov_49.276966.1
MNLGPGISAAASTHPASSSSTASTAKTSTSTSSQGYDGSKTNEAKPQEETFTATFKRQSIISTVEMLTLQCCDYRGRCETLEDRHDDFDDGHGPGT